MQNGWMVKALVVAAAVVAFANGCNSARERAWLASVEGDAEVSGRDGGDTDRGELDGSVDEMAYVDGAVGVDAWDYDGGPVTTSDVRDGGETDGWYEVDGGTSYPDDGGEGVDAN